MIFILVMHIFFLIVLLLLYSPVFYTLGQAWRLDPYYSHGFVIPILSIWLISRKRNMAVQHANLANSNSSLCLIVGLGLYAIGLLIDLKSLQYLSFLVSLIGFLYYVYGTELVKSQAFPLGYLILMFPLPYSVSMKIAFPLQLLSSKYANILINLFGTASLQEGVNIYVPGFDFIIERGCSGLRSAIALFSVSIFFVAMLKASLFQRTFLVFSTIPIALVANIVRIIVVIYLALWFGQEAAQGFFHNFSSLFLFSLAFMMMLLTAKVTGCFPKKSA